MVRHVMLPERRTAAAAMERFVMKSPVREFFGCCVVQHLVCSFRRVRGRWQLFHMQRLPTPRLLLWGRVVLVRPHLPVALPVQHTNSPLSIFIA